MDKVLGITGHRKLSHNEAYVVKAVEILLKDLRPTKVITGMAIGFDIIVAEACIKLGIDFIAAVPCADQTAKWTPALKNRYKIALNEAVQVHHVNYGRVEAWKYHARNKWIVDNSHLVMSYWDGKEKGGSFQTVKEAQLQNKEVINLFTLLRTA